LGSGSKRLFSVAPREERCTGELQKEGERECGLRRTLGARERLYSVVVMHRARGQAESGHRLENAHCLLYVVERAVRSDDVLVQRRVGLPALFETVREVLEAFVRMAVAEEALAEHEPACGGEHGACRGVRGVSQGE
jgi:hypothetical protein